MKHPIYIKIPEDMTLNHLQFMSDYLNAEIVVNGGRAYLLAGEVTK